MELALRQRKRRSPEQRSLRSPKQRSLRSPKQCSLRSPKQRSLRSPKSRDRTWHSDSVHHQQTTKQGLPHALCLGGEITSTLFAFFSVLVTPPGGCLEWAMRLAERVCLSVLFVRVTSPTVTGFSWTAPGLEFASSVNVSSTYLVSVRGFTLI